MKESEQRSDFIPLFKESLLHDNPSQARVLLQSYWKQQSTLSAWHLQEAGVANKTLCHCVDWIADMIRDDSERLGEAFGSWMYTTNILDGLIEANARKISESVDPRFQEQVEVLSKRYFTEQKTRYIFTYTPEERLYQACLTNGGVPGWTREEAVLLDALQ